MFSTARNIQKLGVLNLAGRQYYPTEKLPDFEASPPWCFNQGMLAAISRHVKWFQDVSNVS